MEFGTTTSTAIERRITSQHVTHKSQRNSHCVSNLLLYITKTSVIEINFSFIKINTHTLISAHFFDI